MDEFDSFNQLSTQTQSENNQSDDLYQSDMQSTASIANIADNTELDNTWMLDNNVTDTTISQPSLLNDYNPDITESSISFDAQETPMPSAITSSFDGLTIDTVSNSSTNVTLETSTYEMFAAPMPSNNIQDYYQSTGSFSEENLSILEAFNRRRQKEIADKDEQENKKIEGLRQQAKGDIERWYKERKMRMEQNRERINSDENELRQKAAEKSNNELCDWAKVIRFLEFTQGTQLSKAKRDLSRMKVSIINAKRDQDKRQSVELA